MNKESHLQMPLSRGTKTTVQMVHSQWLFTSQYDEFSIEANESIEWWRATPLQWQILGSQNLTIPTQKPVKNRETKFKNLTLNLIFPIFETKEVQWQMSCVKKRMSLCGKSIRKILLPSKQGKYECRQLGLNLCVVLKIPFNIVTTKIAETL